jgi:hypothetical protein
LLIEHVLNTDRPEDEQILAAGLLVLNATALVPAAGDEEQDWESWPTLTEPWPPHLPSGVKDALILLAARVLLARERKYWEDRSGSLAPVVMLAKAHDDPDYRDAASSILVVLFDLGFMKSLGVDIEDESAKKMREEAQAHPVVATHSFAQLLTQFEPWAKGQTAP